jgi:hypothetical protein
MVQFERILAINLPERTDHRDGLILAAAVSNLHIDFIDGVHGNNVLSKVLPPHRPDSIDAARIGSWRAHINAISRYVRYERDSMAFQSLIATELCRIIGRLP